MQTNGESWSSGAEDLEEVLGKAVVADQDRAYDELVKQAAGVDLSEHPALKGVDIERLQDSVAGLGVKDPDLFLRIHTIKFMNDLPEGVEPGGFSDYVDGIVARIGPDGNPII